MPAAEEREEIVAASSLRGLEPSNPSCHSPAMSTLAEIEAAAETLPEQEKEELFLFLAARLRAAGPAELPPPRKFSREQMEEWIRDDEEGMKRFREGR